MECDKVPRWTREAIQFPSVRVSFARILALAFFCAIASTGLSARTAETEAPWDGKVVRVVDGDSLEILKGGSTHKVRIAGIDCPEKRQPFYTQARSSLSALVFGKSVRVTPIDTDRYGRTVARLRVGSTDVGLHLVTTGMAWHFVQYSDDAALSRAEKLARRQRIGLWRDARPVPPWEFRNPDSGHKAQATKQPKAKKASPESKEKPKEGKSSQESAAKSGSRGKSPGATVPAKKNGSAEKPDVP